MSMKLSDWFQKYFCEEIMKDEEQRWQISLERKCNECRSNTKVSGVVIPCSSPGLFHFPADFKWDDLNGMKATFLYFIIGLMIDGECLRCSNFHSYNPVKRRRFLLELRELCRSYPDYIVKVEKFKD